MNKQTSGAPAPTIASILRTAVQEVTGEKINGAVTDTPASNYATVRTIRSDNSMRRDFTKIAQVSGMGGGVNQTSPGFYSPFTTPSSFQIPNNRKEVYLWAQWWYDNEPKVAAGIDFYTDFPLSGFKLECDNGYVKDYFEGLVKKLNFPKWNPLISHEYHLRGDCFIMMSIDCRHCHGTNWDEDRDERCDHAGATWRSISILNPDMVEVTTTFLDSQPDYFYIPTDEMMKVVAEQKPRELYESIPNKVKEACMQKKPIKLDQEAIWQLKHGSAAFQPFGTSLIRRLFPTLAYKDKLRQAQWLVAERHIIPIKIVKVGNKDRPASEEDLQAVQDELTNVASDPLLTLVTHDAFEFEFVGASGKVLQLTNEYELIDQEIIDGLMLNKAIINGEGPSYSNAQVGLITMAKRLERFREEVGYWIEERLFRPCAVWNGFVTEGKRGQEEVIYPTIKWDDLQLRDDTGKMQVMAQLQQAGVISAETMIELLDIDYDQEVQRLRYEQASNMVNSPDIANSDSMGSGFRGGLGAPAPLGAPPTADLGGAPPIGGADSGMGAPPGMPTAASFENAETMYRLSSSIVNDLYARRIVPFEKQMAVRLASKQILSEAHRGFLESMRPVTGRGNVGTLPDYEDVDIFPLFESAPVLGGYSAMAMNQLAHVACAQHGVNRDGEYVEASNESITLVLGANLPPTVPPNTRLAAPKSKQPNRPTLFTKLEQKLYSVILSGNIPYAFFAQYQAGPGAQYQLDGAFPALKLGIEADSSTFHSAPEKVSTDRRRDMELATQGWTILRFTEDEIGSQQNEILSVIYSAIRKLAGGGSGIKSNNI